MTGRLIIIASEYQEGWEVMEDVYQCLGIDGIVVKAKSVYPHMLCHEPFEEEIKGDIQDQNDDYIITSEDTNMGEFMRVYEKVNQ